MRCGACGDDFEPTRAHQCEPSRLVQKLKPPTGGQWRIHWDAFAQALTAKLDRGYQEYGDGSFDLPLSRLLDELQEECLDISGWGLLLWVRLNRIKETIGAVDPTPRTPGGNREGTVG